VAARWLALWFGHLVARTFDTGLSDETLQLYACWVMRGENLVLVQTPPENVEKVLTLMRESETSRPTTFLVRPALNDPHTLAQRLKRDSSTHKSGNVRCRGAHSGGAT
jgi:hypothetical protein